MHGRTTVSVPTVYGCHTPYYHEEKNVRHHARKAKEEGRVPKIKRHTPSFLNHTFPERYLLKLLLRENDVMADIPQLRDDVHRIVSKFFGCLGLELTVPIGGEPEENLQDIMDEAERLLVPLKYGLQLYVIDKKVQIRLFKELGIFDSTFLYFPLSKVSKFKGRQREWLIDFLGIIRSTQCIMDKNDSSTLEYFLDDDNFRYELGDLTKKEMMEQYGDRIEMMKIYLSGPYDRYMKRINRCRRTVKQLMRSYRRMAIEEEHKAFFETLTSNIHLLEKYFLADYSIDLFSSGNNDFNNDENSTENIFMNIFVWSLDNDVICDYCYEMMNNDNNELEQNVYVQWKILTDDDYAPLEELEDIKLYEQYIYDIIEALNE